MQLLARSVTSLKTGLETQEKVSSLHYLGSLTENTELLAEVNQLRKEVCRLILAQEIVRYFFANRSAYWRWKIRS